MKKVYLYVVVFAIVVCQLFTNRLTFAATINVPADFSTIQAAIDSSINGDTVKVAAGAYFEFVVMKDGVNLEGAGAELTSILTNSNSFTVQVSDNATFSGFLVTNNTSSGVGVLSDGVSSIIADCIIRECLLQGIFCQNGGSPSIKNNVIESNGDNGVASFDATGKVKILNNIINNNGDNGISAGASRTTIKNNIIYNQTGNGIIINGGSHNIENNTISFNGGSSNHAGIRMEGGLSSVVNNIITFSSGNARGIFADRGAHIISFNDVFGNSGDYVGIDPGFGDISEDPLFVDSENGDFLLKAGSPAIDAGNQTIIDSDGTRSDMGAFGGPGAEKLSNGNSVGPTVTDLVVSPNPVVQGQPITIRAVGSVQ